MRGSTGHDPKAEAEAIRRMREEGGFRAGRLHVGQRAVSARARGLDGNHCAFCSLFVNHVTLGEGA